jgi:hypothetical protein
MSEEAGETTIPNASDVVPNALQQVADLIPDDAVDEPAPLEDEPEPEEEPEKKKADEKEPEQEAEAEETEEEPEAETEGDDGKPWDEDRIKAERAKLEENTAAQELLISKKFAALKRREAKAKQVLAHAQTERAQLKETKAAVLDDVKILQTGQPDAVLDALSRITRRPAREVLEQMVNNLAEGGPPQQSRELDELRAKVAELESGRTQRTQAQQLEQQIAQSRQMIGTGVQLDQFPRIKSIATESHAQFHAACQDVETYMIKQTEKGRRLDVHSALTELEYLLQQQTTPADAGRPGRETRGNGQKPAAAPQQPTVTPTIAARRTTATRPRTDREKLQALHEFIPDEAID